MGTRKILLASALLAALGFVGVAAGQSYRTRLTAAEYPRVLAQRELRMDCFGAGEAPATDTNLAECRVQRDGLVTGVELVVGRRLGTSGNTSLHLTKNGVTILSSTVSVAFNVGVAGTVVQGSARSTFAQPMYVVAGDLIGVRIGAVTAGTTSQRVSGRAEIVERF